MARGNEPDPRTRCPDCGGSGVRRIPYMDPWGDVEDWIERPCSFCGGVGDFDAIQAAEMQAEMGAAAWFDWGAGG